MPFGIVAFKEIPQRELRDNYIGVGLFIIIIMLHSKKSHKGN
jgi:hypothetical protein